MRELSPIFEAMSRLSNFSTVFFIAFLFQVLTVHGLPEPRSTVTHCGAEGAAPYCASGFKCCGPFFRPIDGSEPAFGTCVPESGPCPL
ncbi:hypothetical protein BDP27DRAFT_1412815 [Rhodocollybia butyracea]|uniref:Uncharacterized protein n=1 Tax=Rhodocollybia butyracea TaxID=206335 RepID=A0A9P5QC44_9AGAR|nr:hypothetical protein BDP27DRAFT_1412815 [Rhodocollybia butyracea]